MGLTVTPRPARRPFTLIDQNGQPTPVPAQPPRVVVLTFFNAPCNDICPVLAAEIEQADADLGRRGRGCGVRHGQHRSDRPGPVGGSAGAAGRPGSAPCPTGTWSRARWPRSTRIWKAYGVSISVKTKTGLEAHNDVMDFIDPQGDLRYRATPFADESTTGSYSLPAASIARWGQGIATYAGRLVDAVTECLARQRPPEAPIWQRRRGLVIGLRSSC